MANPYFNATYYLTNNPDLFANGINTAESAWNHYVNHGAAESLNGGTSRQPAPWFDATYYLKNNPDLAIAKLQPGQLFEHFVNYGIAEGRSPSAAAVMTETNLLAYAKGNADLLEAFGIEASATELTDAQEAALAGHFYQFGYKESRPAAPFDANVDPGKVGETFTLTTGVDNIQGTAGNDIVSGVFDKAGTQSTLQLADLIDGAAGVNTAAIRYTDSTGAGTATIAAASTPVLKNIQVLELTPLVAANANLTGIAPDLNTINILNPVGSATITAAPTAVKTVGLSGVNSDNADVSITFAAGLTGKNDAVTLNVSGASAATKATPGAYAQVDFAGAAGSDGVDIINVNSAGSSANRLDTLTAQDNAAASTLTTVNIEGAAAFRVNTALANTVKTIDASKSTGGVNLGVTAGDNVTFTGGAGNDRIDMAGGLTADDKLDGGAGTNTLAINNATITATKTAAINKAIDAATNFQVLELTAAVTAASTAPISVAANGLTTIKTFAFTGGGTGGDNALAAGSAGLDAISLTGFGSANTNKLEIGATYTGGAGIAAAASSGGAGGAGGDALQVAPGTNSPADETTITLKGFTLTGGAGAKGDGSGAGGVGGYGINVADFETINLVSTGATATASNSLVAGAGAGGSANGAGILINTNGIINVTGANDLTFTTQTVNPAAGGVQVKAASFTGKLDVTGTTGNDLITGGTNDDKITGGAGRDTIDLSAGGKDTVVLNITAAADRDTIKGFTAGADSDKLDIDLTLGTSVLKTITGTGTAFTIAATDAVTAFNFAATNNSANLAGATDGTELLKGIANQGSTISALTVTASDTGYLVAYDGTNAYVYYYAEGDAAATLEADEIALIGVLENVATGTLVAGNFA